MRFGRLVASGFLAAGIGLVACSSSSTPSLPGGSQGVAQAARAAHSAFHFVGVGSAPDVSCPSQFALCVTVSKSKPAKTSVCIQESSVCAPGTWTWTQQIETLGGNPFKNLVGKLNPNPGNPTEDTIREKKALKPSHGAPKYQQLLEACSSSQCVQGVIGIITK